MSKIVVEVEIETEDEHFSLDAWEGVMNGYFQNASFKVRQSTKRAIDDITEHEFVEAHQHKYGYNEFCGLCNPHRN